MAFLSILLPYQIRGCNRDSSAVQAGDERTALLFPLTMLYDILTRMRTRKGKEKFVNEKQRN